MGAGAPGAPVAEPLVGVFSDSTHVQVEVPVFAAELVLMLLALRARAADTGFMHPVSA